MESLLSKYDPLHLNSANNLNNASNLNNIKNSTNEENIETLSVTTNMESLIHSPLNNCSRSPDYNKAEKLFTDFQGEVENRSIGDNALVDEKKNASLRKNIRDVMDENQLDTITLAAQREESERLARVAEQHKIIREYQRQTAANKKIARLQNRNLLYGHTVHDFTDKNDNEILESTDNISNSLEPIENKSIHRNKYGNTLNHFESQDEDIPINEVVTIEDSSENDCILLSDEEEEEELYDNEDIIEDDPNNSGLHVNDTYNKCDEFGRVAINIGHPDDEDDIYVAPQIAATIKPHQIGGVRFLFDNIIESVNRFKTSTGFGCILSHSMGLGKTLQLICFCDIFLRHTSSKTILCVMPINTLQNWLSEFDTWLPRTSSNYEKIRPRDFDVFVLNDQHKTLNSRAKIVLKWSEEGGVLLIGYELFRLLSQKLASRKRTANKMCNSEANKNILEKIHSALVKPGPDLVICDEGHRIKNSHAGISVALKQIRTRRRIVLTGYPLQNNLLEYWCMVDFVRPNYLGTRTEFCNMFERPIQNGQCVDSTPEDIKLMRYRAHVLHSLLVGFVQRRSHLVLQQTLPEKLEYVVLTRMTDFQRQLYDTFMNDIVRSKIVPNPLKAFAMCCKIWNHPDVLYNFLKKNGSDLDLDLEIDDGEIGEITQKTSGDQLKSDKRSNTSANYSMDGGLGSSINYGYATNLPESKSLKSIYNPVENKPFNLSCGDMYSQEYNEMQNKSHSNTNNFWAEQNGSYFNNQNFSNINVNSKLNFVGVLSKNQTIPSSLTETLKESSEIVDLDTKEIKTIETNINMNPNQILKRSEVGHDTDICNTYENKTSNQNNLLDSSITKQMEKDIKVKNCDKIMYEWAIGLMKKYEPGHITYSPKMEVFFCILNETISLGDRLLLFSQSLLTLNLIEHFLQQNSIPNTHWKWARNSSYFRLDGSTTSQEREKLVNEFNQNTNVKLFLISTKAGSLGINLFGANRVVVFDASWNPCHDTQAVYRIYRYGQKKRCYVYRIVMDKCLEKKIYDRQIKKQAMSNRVVDECNPDAHMSLKEVTNLCHDYDENDKNPSNSDLFTQPINSYLDYVIQKVIIDYKKCLSKEPFFHESLLIDRKEKKLSQAEKRLAHRGYEMEKKASIKQNYFTNKAYNGLVNNGGSNRPVASIRPMQAQFSKKTGGIRSTRWIPADVWQKQGMSAQEMILPLDVVIPTNSSDKSNIILKSGQRVMVLKSDKGIYMQLENGKIIAIRTSNKESETKANSNEVIDITSDAESIGDTKDVAEEKHKTITATSISDNQVQKCTKPIECPVSNDKLEIVNTVKEQNSTQQKIVETERQPNKIECELPSINNRFTTSNYNRFMNQNVKTGEIKANQCNTQRMLDYEYNNLAFQPEYNSHSYPQCSSLIPPNSYDNCMAPSLGTNSFHLPWPPYLNSSLVNQQYALFPQNYSSNGHQSNEFR